MYWQTSQLEEMPGLKAKETLEYARYISMQTQAEDWKGLMPGRKYYHCGIMHGTRFWTEDAIVYGPAMYRFVWNRSGSPLVWGALAKWYALTGITATGGAINYLTDTGKFTAYEEVGNMIYILDAQATGGVAPEGDIRFIVKNTSGRVYVQPDFSTIILAGDTAEISSRVSVIASADGDTRAQLAGIVVSPDGIPDNYGGWIGTQGVFACLVQSGTGITALEAVKAHTGAIADGNGCAQELTIGFALHAMQTDCDNDIVPVDLDLETVLGATS